MKILGPDNTFTGNVLVAGSIGNQDSGVFVAFPDGGSYENPASTITGAIKVTLPNSWVSTMMQFEVGIWDYATNESFTVVVAGYAYNDTSTGNPRWLNTTAYILGKNINRDYTVRLGHDGTKCCVYIGELTSTWAYLGIRVKNFQGSFNNDTFDLWKAGWAVGIESTAFGTISSTLSDNFVISSYAKNADKLDGKDSAEFSLAGHTHAGSDITEDSTHRFFTDTERTKLSGIETNANNYVHPATHDPSIIAQDSSNRFVSDSEKNTWNAKESATVESIIVPTLENSWANYGASWSAVGYYKDRGRVFLQGILAGGAVNTTIFTLPEGYRPPAHNIVTIVTSTGFGYIRIYSDGRVVLMGGGLTWISLDSVSIRV